MGDQILWVIKFLWVVKLASNLPPRHLPPLQKYTFPIGSQID